MAPQDSTTVTHRQDANRQDVNREDVSREAEDWMHVTIERAREGFIELDEDRRVRSANATAAAILGYGSVDELLADRPRLGSFVESLSSDDLEMMDEELRRVGSVETTRLLRQRSGDLRWVDARAFATSDDGAWKGTVVTMIDVTDTYRSRSILEAVRETSERLLRGRWRDELPTVLARLAEAAEVDRAFVVGVMEGATSAAPAVLATWQVAGMPPLDEAWSGTCFRAAADAAIRRQRIADGGLHEIPGRTGPCVSCAIRSEIGACEIVPITNGHQWGALGFQHRTAREWTSSELDAMRAVAGAVAAAMDREAAEERYRRLTERIPGVTYELTVRADGQVERYVSPQVEGLLGYPSDTWTEGSWEAALHLEDLARATAENQRIVAAPGPYALDYRMIRADGTTVWVHDAGEHVAATDHQPAQIRGLLIDVTARHEAQVELETTIELLRTADRHRRTLMQELHKVQETERSRIAADLHDDAVQAMTVVGLRLDLLLDASTDPEVTAHLAKISESVSGAIGRLRRTLFELRPPALGDGIVPALRTYLAQQDGEDHLRWELQDGLRQQPSEQTGIAMYRIAQEALTNVRRHARASTVTIELGQCDEGYLLRVVDDGVGFEPESYTRANGHIGLVSMRDRAAAAGGSLQIRSEAGRGTTVECRLPDLDTAGFAS